MGFGFGSFFVVVIFWLLEWMTCHFLSRKATSEQCYLSGSISSWFKVSDTVMLDWQIHTMPAGYSFLFCSLIYVLKKNPKHFPASFKSKRIQKEFEQAASAVQIVADGRNATPTKWQILCVFGITLNSATFGNFHLWQVNVTIAIIQQFHFCSPPTALLWKQEAIWIDKNFCLWWTLEYHQQFWSPLLMHTHNFCPPLPWFFPVVVEMKMYNQRETGNMKEQTEAARAARVISFARDLDTIQMHLIVKALFYFVLENRDL